MGIEKKCNLCGSMSSRFLFYGQDRLHKVDKKTFKIEKCLNCGLVFLSSPPSSAELKKYYPSDYGPYQDGDNPLKYGAVSRALKSLFLHLKQKWLHPKIQDKKDETVFNLLDLGCGSGNFLEKMKRLYPNWRLAGFDNSETACVHTRSKGFEVWGGDFMEADLPKGYFDIINLSHVIEHLDNPKEALSKISSLLKPEGKIIITTPNFDSLSSMVFKKYWFALEAPRHLFIFSPKNIYRLLSEAGFSGIHIVFDPDVRVAIKSLNYLFDRQDMRINFFIWHLLWAIFKPIGWGLSFVGKTSIMIISAKKA